jgi:hypothetical protein
MAGLQCMAVQRLKHTWSDLSPKSRSIYDQLAAVLSADDDLKAYRALLATCEVPAIPFLCARRRGVLLRGPA